MWHLNFIIPFAVAFVGLMAPTVLLVKLLSDAIVDGTAKNGGKKPGAEVALQEGVAGTKPGNADSPKSLLELPGVARKAPQCAGELVQ